MQSLREVRRREQRSLKYPWIRRLTIIVCNRSVKVDRVWTMITAFRPEYLNACAIERESRSRARGFSQGETTLRVASNDTSSKTRVIVHK